MSVTKSQAELYQVRSGKGSCAWGDITLVCGKQSVSVMATSDYGSFDYYWSHCGGEPKDFLCGLDFQYTMKKLTNGKLYVANPDGYIKEIKENIINSRRCETLSRKEARTAWREMLEHQEEYPEGDLFYKGLVDHDLFEKVFGDYECLPSSTTECCHAVDFWKDIWTPFIESLRAELKESASNKSLEAK
ncbi:hypothetical protein KO527_05325 [Pseudoalteromonas sp. C2R02]|nr:hypothetical protein [Pseudoalteromonas sp. C2R02]